MKLLEIIPEKLLEVLDHPPYSQFFYIGSIFVAISLIFDKHFNILWLFFLLSVGGMVIRYIERDFLGHFEVKDIRNLDKDKKRIRFKVLTVYHIFNFAWVIALLYFFWINI